MWPNEQLLIIPPLTLLPFEKTDQNHALSNWCFRASKFRGGIFLYQSEFVFPPIPVLGKIRFGEHEPILPQNEKMYLSMLVRIIKTFAICKKDPYRQLNLKYILNSGHISPQAAASSCTILAFVLKRSSLVIPGFLGIPAAKTTIRAPWKHGTVTEMDLSRDSGI